MKVLAAVCFALALIGGTGALAGALWALLAEGVWGHLGGPPPGLSPSEARAWAQAYARGADAPHTFRWRDVPRAWRERRWREMWPLLFMAGGVILVGIFLPLGLWLAR